MIGWITLGSLLTLATAFGLTTFHYRRRARRAESKTESESEAAQSSPLESVAAKGRSKKKSRTVLEGVEAEAEARRFLKPSCSQTRPEFTDYYLGNGR